MELLNYEDGCLAKADANQLGPDCTYICKEPRGASGPDRRLRFMQVVEFEGERSLTQAPGNVRKCADDLPKIDRPTDFGDYL